MRIRLLLVFETKLLTLCIISGEDVLTACYVVFYLGNGDVLSRIKSYTYKLDGISPHCFLLQLGATKSTLGIFMARE